MTKLRKTLMAVGVLLASSMAFVGCSDDIEGTKLPGNKLGACYLQQLTAYTNQVALQWTITPTSNVEGYLVQIYQGTRDNMGSLVGEQTFGNKVYQGTITGLQPNTNYVVVTQCIPAKGSKFTDADVAYREFWTAPVLTITSVNATVNESGEDEEGNPIYSASVTVSWAESLDKQQINGAYLSIEDEEENQLFYSLVNTGATFGNSATVTVPGVTPGGNVIIALQPYPSQYCFYTTATSDWTDDYPYTLPAAQ